MATFRDFSVQKASAPAVEASDRGTGTSAFAGTRAIHCNVADTYEVTFVGTGTVDMILSDGVTYPFSVTNVLNTSSGAIDAGDITLLY